MSFTRLRWAPDKLVALAAQINKYTLIAVDGDMRQIARSAGISNNSYKKLSLIKLSCYEPNAAARVGEAMSLIEHEWDLKVQKNADRIFIEIGNTTIKTNR